MTHVTCHVTTHDSDNKKWQTPTLLYCFIFLAAKQHKKRTIWVRRWLLDRYVTCWSYISSADCLWKLNHALEVGQLYRSSDVGFRFNYTSFTHIQTSNSTIANSYVVWFVTILLTNACSIALRICTFDFCFFSLFCNYSTLGQVPQK